MGLQSTKSQQPWNETWKEEIKKERSRRQAQIDTLTNRLNDIKDVEWPMWEMIYSCDDNVQKLAELTRSGRVSCLHCLHAYQFKALAAHARTNCAAEFLLEAEAQAVALDEKFAPVPKHERPPLFGVPFSVKEHLQVAGHVTNCGWAHWLRRPPADCDAAPVDMLRRAGAVPFVRTNVPMGMIAWSCSNPTYGTTLSPLRAGRTCGGSSGGEAALVAQQGAPFGLGTDGGGSVRIPATMCGLAGLKPTSTRVSQWGIPSARNSAPGVVLLGVTWGPMAPSVHTLVQVLRAVLNDAAMIVDPYYLCVPFRQELYESDEKLRIGYLDFDGWWQCTPAAKRAVALAKEALEQDGHELVPWEVPDAGKALKLFLKQFFPAAGASVGQLVKNEGNFWEPHIAQTLRNMSLPVWLKRALGALLEWTGLRRFKRVALLLRSASNRNTDLAEAQSDTLIYRRQLVLNWRRHNITAVLMPAFVGVAPKTFYPDKCLYSAVYTAVWNLVDFAAGTLPVTVVTDEDERMMKTYPSDDSWHQITKEDQSNGTVGLPVSVQCVTLPQQEETCLRLMAYLQKKLPVQLNAITNDSDMRQQEVQ